MWGPIQILVYFCMMGFISADFDVGDAPIKRAYLQTEQRKMYVTNDAHPVPREGHCTTFTYYGIRSDLWGSAVFQVFSPIEDNMFKSIHYSSVRIGKDGINKHTIESWKKYVNVRKGDLVAIDVFNDPNIVSYDAEECKQGDIPSRFYNITPLSTVNKTFYEIPEGSKPCRKYSLQLNCMEGSAQGPLPVDRADTDSSMSRMYVMNYDLIWNGNLTTWELYAKRPGEIYLQVFRGNDNSPKSTVRYYKLIASKLFNITEAGFNRLKLDDGDKVNVQQGDRLGFYYKNGNPIPYDKTSLCYTRTQAFPIEGNSEMWYKDNPRKLRVGKTYKMKKLTAGIQWPQCRYYSLKGIIFTE